MAVGAPLSKPSCAGCGHCCQGQGQAEDEFEELVLSLKVALGPSSGLTSDDIDVDALRALMGDYDANDKRWSPYALSDKNRAYTRNLVDEGNGKSNLLVLVWTPGKGSPIHDHGNAHCLMKILQGSLTESRFAFPDSDKEQPMQLIKETTYKRNQVAYMADELGLHKMENKGSNYAVSLHLYTPPNVAKSGCNIFEPRTGKRNHIPNCGYYSKFRTLLKDS